MIESTYNEFNIKHICPNISLSMKFLLPETNDNDR